MRPAAAPLAARPHGALFAVAAPPAAPASAAAARNCTCCWRPSGWLAGRPAATTTSANGQLRPKEIYHHKSAHLLELSLRPAPAESPEQLQRQAAAADTQASWPGRFRRWLSLEMIYEVAIGRLWAAIISISRPAGGQTSCLWSANVARLRDARPSPVPPLLLSLLLVCAVASAIPAGR